MTSDRRGARREAKCYVQPFTNTTDDGAAAVPAFQKGAHNTDACKASIAFVEMLAARNSDRSARCTQRVRMMSVLQD